MIGKTNAIGGSGGGGMTLYHVTQTIDGDTCTLSLTDYDGEESENYWVGANIIDGTQQLFLMSDEDVMGELDTALQDLNSGGGV